MRVKRLAPFFLMLALLYAATSCYQVHSGDELRTIPVTNNPNVVPQRSPMAGIPSVKI